jgi:plastocyanin
MKLRIGSAPVLAALCSLMLAGPALAADPVVNIAIRNHVFIPAEIKVPAATKIKLVVENEDATAEEFDSHALNREKVIPPRSKAVIFIGPLAPGKYPFIGEFHETTAQGVVIAE